MSDEQIGMTGQMSPTGKLLNQMCLSVLQKYDRGMLPRLSPLQNLLLTFDLNPTLDEEQFPNLTLTQRLQKYGLKLQDAEALTTDVMMGDPTEDLIDMEPDLEPEPEALQMLQTLNPSEAVEFLIPMLVGASLEYQ